MIPPVTTRTRAERKNAGVPRPRQRISTVAIGAAWLVGVSALCTLVDGFLGNVLVARAVLGGLLVSVALGRAGVLWDDDDPDGDSYKQPALLALRACARSASIALVAIALSIGLGWATVGRGSPGLAMLVGLLAALGGAVRDELLLRALPIHFARRARLVGGDAPKGWSSIKTPGELAVVGFCALLSIAPILAAPRSTASAIALAASIGALHAVYQLRSRSVWGPVASGFLLRLLLGPTLQTGLLRVEWKAGELMVGTLAGGHAVWVFAGLAMVVAVFGVPTRPPPSPDPLSDGPSSQGPARPRRPRTPRPPPGAPEQPEEPSPASRP